MIPRLPLELERGIFEIAALKDRQDAYRLLLVARRAHTWYVTNQMYMVACTQGAPCLQDRAISIQSTRQV